MGGVRILGNRLKEFRKANKLTQQVFAKPLKTSSGHISEIESGIKKPGSDFLLSLTRVYGINVNWLLTGEGEMYAAQTKPLKEQANIPEIGERIRFARLNLGLSTDALAIKAGTTRLVIANSEKNNKRPEDPDICEKLVIALQVSSKWLFFNEGHIYKSKSAVVNIGLSELDDTSREILALLKNLDDDKRRDVLRFIQKENLFESMLKKFTGE